MKPLNILIVEDDKVASALIERNINLFFGDKAITVFTASTLTQALQLVRVRGPIQLTLADLQLEDSSAENTLKSIQQLGDAVLVMSGVASGATYRECKRHGARDYIEKPIVMELLVEKMAHILDRDVDEEGDERGLIDIQRDAQTRLAQKTAPVIPSVVLSPVSSRWLKVILPATGTLAMVAAIVIGFVLGSWRTAVAQGAEKQANTDRLIVIERDVKELKEDNKERGQVLINLQIDVAKLVARDPK